MNNIRIVKGDWKACWKKIIIARKDELKGSQLKLMVISEQMKNLDGIAMKEEDFKEYGNLAKALNVNVKKI